MRAGAVWSPVLVALVLAACGGDDGDEETTTAVETETTATAETAELPRDPCRLLDRQRITELFGTRVRGRFEEGTRADVCGYRTGREADQGAPPPAPAF